MIKQILFILLSLLLVSCTDEAIDIKMGQFTEIQFDTASQKLQYTYTLDNSNQSVPADLYINLQNPALFTALQFSISKDGKEISSGDSTQTTTRDTKLISHTQCEAKCVYTAEFSLTDKEKFVNTPVSYFQFLTYDGETEESKETNEEYPVYGPIEIQTKNNLLEAISQNLLIDPTNENGIQTKKFCFFGDFRNYDVPSSPQLFISAAQNSEEGDFQIGIVATNIDQQDLQNVEKWPKYDSYFFSQQFAYREKNNAFIKNDFNLIANKYFAVSVYVKYDPSKVKSGSFLVSMQSLYKYSTQFKYETDLSINKVVQGHFIKADKYSQADIGFVTLTPERSSLYFQVYSIDNNSDNKDVEFVQDYNVKQTSKTDIDPFQQFVYVQPEQKQFYLIFFPVTQHQIIESRAGRSSDQTVQGLKTFNENTKFTFDMIFYYGIDADNYSYKSQELEVRFKVSDGVKQDKVQVQYQIINSHVLPPTLKESQIYDQLPEYSTNDGSRILKVTSFPETGQHFLIIKIVKNQEIPQSQFIACTTEFENTESKVFQRGEQKYAQMNRYFQSYRFQFKTNNDELKALGTNFLISSFYGNQDLQMGLTIVPENEIQSDNEEQIGEHISEINESNESNGTGRYSQYFKYTLEEISKQCPNKCTFLLTFSSKKELQDFYTIYYKLSYFTQKEKKNQPVWGAFTLPTPQSQKIQSQIMQKTDNPIQVFHYQVNAEYGDQVIVAVNTNNPINKNQFHLVKASSSNSNDDTYPSLSDKQLEQIWSEAPVTYSSVIPLDICREKDGCKQLFSLFVNYKDTSDLSSFFILGKQRKSAQTLMSYIIYTEEIFPSLFPTFNFVRLHVSDSKIAKNLAIDIGFEEKNKQGLEEVGKYSSVYLLAKDDNTKDLVPLSSLDQLNNGADFNYQYPTMEYYYMYMMDPTNVSNKIQLSRSSPTRQVHTWDLGEQDWMIFYKGTGVKTKYMKREKSLNTISLVLGDDKKSKNIKVQYRSTDKIEQNTGYPIQNGSEHLQNFENGQVVYNLDGEGSDIFFSFVLDQEEFGTRDSQTIKVKLVEGIYTPEGKGLGLGWIILIVVLVLIAIGGVVFFIIKKRKQNQSKQEGNDNYQKLNERNSLEKV